MEQYKQKIYSRISLLALPQATLQAGFSLTVLTYKVEGSLFGAYLCKLGLPFQLETDASMDRKFREKATQLIAIENIPAL